MSVLFVARAGISLVVFAIRRSANVNPNAHTTLVVLAALGSCIALGALILSVSQWRGARATRWGVLRALWLLCIALMLIEWTVSLASSG